jgi:Mn2+/Fe2+ NRAMP family transporter
LAKFAEIFLGILTAMGGFVEIGELTFTLNAGQHFQYTLLWVTVLGTVGIMVYCEMAGRVAAVRKRAVFHLVRERAGFSSAALTLVAALAVNLLTCAAEIGAVAMLLQLAFGSASRLWILVAFATLLLVLWFVSFQWIERIYGLGGLLLIVFMVTLASLGPHWHEAAQGLVPHLPPGAGGRDALLYFYYAVALLSSIMLPYETYFYASGGIEDGWKPGDVTLNRVVVLIGFALGGLLSASLVGVGAQYFAPRGIEPQLPGSAALAPIHAFGAMGLWCALLGMFFAFGGAAIETALASAYNLAQFAGWPWGKHRPKRETGRFTISWVAVLLLGTLLALTGVNVIAIVEYSIVFSVVILPFTYFPVLMVAGDRRIMGTHANGPFARILGWFYLVLLTLAAVAAIPLLLLTHGGRG